MQSSKSIQRKRHSKRDRKTKGHLSMDQVPPEVKAQFARQLAAMALGDTILRLVKANKKDRLTITITKDSVR